MKINKHYLIQLIKEVRSEMIQEDISESKEDTRVRAIRTAWEFYCNGTGGLPLDDEGVKIPHPDGKKAEEICKGNRLARGL